MQLCWPHTCGASPGKKDRQEAIAVTWERRCDLVQGTAREVGIREGSEIHSEGKTNRLSCWMDVGREKKREVISASEVLV